MCSACMVHLHVWCVCMYGACVQYTLYCTYTTGVIEIRGKSAVGSLFITWMWFPCVRMVSKERTVLLITTGTSTVYNLGVVVVATTLPNLGCHSQRTVWRRGQYLHWYNEQEAPNGNTSDRLRDIQPSWSRERRGMGGRNQWFSVTPNVGKIEKQE